jgi:Fis family transcriptional regulator, factor for inversion stimulation protein
MSAEAVSLRRQPLGPVTETRKGDPLSACVREAVDGYLRQLDGHEVSGLYQLVLAEVERPLLEAVMANARGNQTQAARILGISRGTLRKLLARYEVG